MRTIWKYEIFGGTATKQIPKGARFLSFQLQGSTPCMWFTVETDNPMEDREFFMIGTGGEIPQNLFTTSEYLGTVQLYGGSVVLHLFEALDPVKASVKTTFTVEIE